MSGVYRLPVLQAVCVLCVCVCAVRVVYAYSCTQVCVRRPLSDTPLPLHPAHTLHTLHSILSKSKKGSDGMRDTATTEQREGIKLNDRLKRARPRAGRKQSHRQLRVGSQVLQAISEAAWVIEREDPGYVGKGSERGGVDGG